MSLLIWLTYAVLLLCTSAVSVAAVALTRRRNPQAVAAPDTHSTPPESPAPPPEASPPTEPHALPQPDNAGADSTGSPPRSQTPERQRFVTDWV